jgi:hypothetical protein
MIAYHFLLTGSDVEAAPVQHRVIFVKTKPELNCDADPATEEAWAPGFF